jgi:primase-polymerase (primpol)-like protein
MTTATRTKPAAVRIDFHSREDVPEELRNLHNWLVWKWWWDQTAAKGAGKWDKPPIDPATGKEIDATDPANWMTFINSLEASLRCGDGSGFALGPKNSPCGFVVLDIDHCVDADGNVSPEAMALVLRFNSYAERTPTDGIRIWLRGIKPGDRCRRPSHPDAFLRTVEVYSHSRYLTVTGRKLAGAPAAIATRQAELDALYRELFGTSRKGKGQARVTSPVDIDDESLLDKARKAKYGDVFRALFDDGDLSRNGNDANAADMALANRLAFWTGCDFDRMERLFSASALGKRDKWNGRPDYQARTIDKAIRDCEATYEPGSRGKTKPSPNASESPNGEHQTTAAASQPASQAKRLEIEINTERHLVREEAIKALARDRRIFSRGDVLVMVLRPTTSTIKLPGGTELRKADGAPRIIPLDEPNAGCLLTENASCFKWSKDRNGNDVAHDCHPPDWLIKAVLAKKVWPGIRELLTVAECPYVRRDGTIMSKAGYDESTGTLLIPAFDLPPIPDRPTQKDAKDAWGRIYYHFRQFPFESGHDFTVWLTDFLTSIQRPVIRGPVPGFAYIGNKAGCGKGLLIDCRGVLVWGGPIPTVSYPDDPQEAEKVVLALALGGIQAVHFDNLDESQLYGGSALDSALTCTSRGGRVLGLSKIVDGIPLRPCWCLSGNNIGPGKDAFRRWIPCNLKTTLERPHERGDVDVKNLKAHIADHRAEIIRDALIILEAHAVAGSPPHKKGPLGSFEEWDDAIRAPVFYASDNDCLETQRKAAEDSPKRLEQLALLEGWRTLPEGGGEGYTIQEMLGLVDLRDDKGRPIDSPYPQLHAALLALGMRGKFPDSGWLAYKLRGMKNTPVGGFRFIEAGKHHQAVRWAVEKI